MRKIGYARVSSLDQNLDRQIAMLRAERCERIFREKASGKSVKGRPELEKAIDELGTRDVLVVAEWDRATRNLMDGIMLMERGLLALLSGFAEEERDRILKRANQGRKAAMAAGRRMGRKPKLTADQVAEARKRLTRGESHRSIARSFNVHHARIGRLA
jgi:DNA invertase Pin-like site-specific DNA recombinase